ncbi:ankyrin repeat domain-containing protein [Streptomyces althioticus]|uniref:ankyrin repeat domain-containing protein n=1 Tax=Streptomyces althioticus TaxID=83380 RepID=UPI0033DAEFF6
MSGAELVAAVGRGDAEGVRRLLEGGAAPDTVAEDGLPVLCRAIDAFETDVAEALVEAGADQDRELPDGTTPLMRAVDGGSPAMVTAVLGADPAARLSSERRDELLDRARRLYADGAEVVLGGRVGSAEAVERVTVMDDEYHRVAELRLGGAVVRAGHGAVVTDLEWAFRILPPVAELAARAVATGDPDHVDWSAAAWALYQRRSREAWSEVAALHTSPVALERRFALDVLGMHVVVPWASWRNTYEKETVDLLLSWAVRGEEDSGVLGELLYVLSLTGRPDTSEAGLRHARHQDPRVREQTAGHLVVGLDDTVALPGPEARALLLELARDEDGDVRVSAAGPLGSVCPGDAEATAAVLALLEDPEPEVRAGVLDTIGASYVRCPDVDDALFSLTGSEDFTTRLSAVCGLVLRKDRRAAEAVARLGAVPPGHEDDHRLHAIWRWEWSQDRP